MKNFLFFLLGFFIVVSATLAHSSGKLGDDGICYWITQDIGTNLIGKYTVFYTSLSSSTFFNPDLNIALGSSVIGDNSGYVLGDGVSAWSWNVDKWQKALQLISSSSTGYVTASVRDKILDIADSTTSSMPSSPPSDFCAISCDDSDSDGLCDVCDEKPNDSTVGPTKYVRGYYELQDGTTVATIYSYSATDKTNDLVTIDKKYNYPDKFPGLVYAVGMASYIDEKEFIAGGGRFAGLSKAEPVYTMKCNAVTSSDQCTNAICDITDGAPEILEKLEDVEENGEAQAYPTEQKAADAPYLDLDKTCDELRTKCNSSCGAATNVKSFGCSENKHMVCECLNNGTWEVANNWDELGVAIDQSETTTNNYYGDGDSTTGGGSVDGVSDDGTGGFTGSYEYVEGSYNYDSFGSHYSQLASKFPFSLRTTIGSIYSDFKGVGAAPVYNYTIYGHSVTIDLSSFDDIAKMIRSIFALGVTLSTILMLIYLYVGIDLRGK